MAKMMNIPVLGVVENMSYFECSDCGKKHNIYGESHIDEIAEKYEIKKVAKLPIDKNLASAADKGLIEHYDGLWLEEMLDVIEEVKK
jgi:Mrp family chromosome partitioning ATPase